MRWLPGPIVFIQEEQRERDLGHAVCEQQSAAKNSIRQGMNLVSTSVFEVLSFHETCSGQSSFLDKPVESLLSVSSTECRHIAVSSGDEPVTSLSPITQASRIA